MENTYGPGTNRFGKNIKVGGSNSKRFGTNSKPTRTATGDPMTVGQMNNSRNNFTGKGINIGAKP
jgi:hypothetical protein